MVNSIDFTALFLLFIILLVVLFYTILKIMNPKPWLTVDHVKDFINFKANRRELKDIKMLAKNKIDMKNRQKVY